MSEMFKMQKEKITEIKYHLKSGNGYYVVERKVIPFNLQKMENEELGLFLIENGEAVVSEYDIKSKTRGNIFEYVIYNGGEYEFAEDSSVYSTLYLSEKEFERMCKSVQNNLKGYEKKYVYKIASELIKQYPDIFMDISRGRAFCTNEW